MNPRQIVTVVLLASPLLSVSANQDTLSPITTGEAPTNFDQMWAGFDPLVEPLNIETLRSWEEAGTTLQIVRFDVGTFKGQTAKVAAIYGFPTDRAKRREKLPALLQIHGGGQYADHRACVSNAKRGYATLSLAWAGRISAPKYRVSAREVQLFWDGKTDDPAYRLTTDWGALDGYHAPSRNKGNVFPSAKAAAWTLDAVESPRNSGWFLCAMAARRALTFLEKQPEVDRDRLGVYGHSMGGKLSVMTAVDKRVKAAAPSCGGISDRDNRSELFRRTIGDDVSLRKISCPIIFLSPANDFHGRIGDLPAAVNEIQTDEWRVTCSPHHNHQDTAEYEAATLLWFDQHLRGTFEFPETPTLELKLDNPDGTPSVTVKTIPSRKPLWVDIYYTQHGKTPEAPADGENTKHRFWHHTAASKSSAETWTASLPLFDTKKPLWVYANVRYPIGKTRAGVGYYYGAYTSTDFVLSSVLKKVSAQQLADANVRASLKATQTIEDFEEGWWKHWFSYRPAESWGRTTHKLYSEMYRAPENASLAIDIKSEEENKLVIVVDHHGAEFSLSPDSWTKLTIKPGDLRNLAGEPLADWSSVKRLTIGPYATLRPAHGAKQKAVKLGAEWKGSRPQLKNLRWATE